MSTVRFLHDPNLAGVFPSPTPAVKHMPQWFRAIRPMSSPDPNHTTVKKCVPFLEAMSAGFIIPLWADLYVSAVNGTITFTFPQGFPLPASMESHGYNQIPGHPLAGNPYGKMPFKLISPWIINTDPGYSCIFTSPMNHMESRLKIMDGVVDTDAYYNVVNFPFLWTGGDGQFLIPKGTPLVQVIPFQREKHTCEIGVMDVDRKNNTSALLGTVFADGYRNNYWHKNADRDSDDQQE